MAYMSLFLNMIFTWGYLQNGTRCNRLFLVYLSYLNVYFNYVFAFFWGGRCNELRTDSLFVKFLWVWVVTMAERTGKRYLSYQKLLFFCRAFLFARSPEGPSVSFCSAGSISFTPNIKERTLLVHFFPSLFLPCICTVFKESFVYVFAIKKKTLLKKTKDYSVSIHL